MFQKSVVLHTLETYKTLENFLDNPTFINSQTLPFPSKFVTIEMGYSRILKNKSFLLKNFNLKPLLASKKDVFYDLVGMGVRYMEGVAHIYAYAKNFETNQWYYYNCFSGLGPSLENMDEVARVGLSVICKVSDEEMQKFAQQRSEEEDIEFLIYQRIDKDPLQEKIAQLQQSLQKLGKTFDALKNELKSIKTKLSSE